MTKKRVHELAKDLGLDNRDVMQALQSAGIQVKTHSSAVHEEEALAVLNKFKDSTAAAAQPKRPGMMIVKKRKDADIEEVHASPLQHDVADSMDVADQQLATPAHEPQLAHQDVVHQRHVEQADTHATPASLTTPAVPASEVVHEAIAAHVQHQSFDEMVRDNVSAPIAEEPAPVAEEIAAPVPRSPMVVETTATTSSGRKVDVQRRPDQKMRQGTDVNQPAKPEAAQPNRPTSRSTAPGTPATVVRMIDRDKLLERIPGRRLGGGPAQERRGPDNRGGAPGDRAPRSGGYQGQQAGGGNRQGYTPGGRPGQPTSAGGNRPAGGYNQGGHRPAGGANNNRPAPANRPNHGGGHANTGGGAPHMRFGQVTELKVVTDPFGRGREMVAVGRERRNKGAAAANTGAGQNTSNANAGKGGLRSSKGRTNNKRDLTDMRERSTNPSRLKKKKNNVRDASKAQIPQSKASKRVIKMKQSIVVADLAHQLGVKSVDLVRKLVALGTMVTQNQSIDFDTAQLLASEFEYTVESVAFEEKTHIVQKPETSPEHLAALKPRAPVVTVMGHVDHGKTSLLDAIRRSRVASGEAGGITQHIGAYSVDVPGKGSVTFLDTPGHAAFTSMRARGVKVTDIVVLVVAADDGVMPQTEEAIKHAQAAKAPMIVAINKMDKPDAQPDRVMQELTKYGMLPEAWGGETLYINTSATKGTGVDELLDTILLQAEILELKADPSCPAVGIVIEAQLDRGRGPVATVLVQQGLLRRGDAVVVGEAYGKVRAMVDDQGKQLQEAGPSSAVEITGLDIVPNAGDTLNVVESVESARQVAQHRLETKRQIDQASAGPMSLDDLMKRAKDSAGLELRIVLKADVQGSVEAVRGALVKLSTDEVKVNIIYAGVGAIKESDIMLAAASNGLVLGFGVRPDPSARQTAERERVEIRSYHIIYEAVDEIRRAMEGLLTPESREKILGRAQVRELFRVSKVGVIGGCRVLEGKAMRAARIRVLRDNVQVYDGRVASLRQVKNDAREVEAGLECGVGIEGFNDLKNQDILEFYQIEEIARTLGQPTSSKRPAGNTTSEARA